MKPGTDLLSLRDLATIAKKGAIAFFIALAIGSPTLYYAINRAAHTEASTIVIIVQSGVGVLLGSLIAGFLVGYMRFYIEK